MPGAGQADRATREVGGEPVGELPGHPSREGSDPGDGARRRRGRQDPRLPGSHPREHGCVPHGDHTRYASAGCVPLLRPLRRPGLPRRVQRRVHQHDAHRRLPGGGPARGDLRRRADHRRAGPEGREGPRGDPSAQLHPGLHRAHALSGRPEPGLGRLRSHTGQGAPARRLRRPPQGAAGPTGTGRYQAARHRLLHLPGDVWSGSLPRPVRPPVCRRRLGRGHDPTPAHRQGGPGHRDHAARAGPRDHVRPDRGRRPRGVG